MPTEFPIPKQIRDPVSRDEVNEIPEQWLGYITHFILGLNSTSINYKEPHIRPSVKQYYWVFIILYGVLIVWGVLTNIGMILYIVRYRFYRDPTYCFLINIAICDILKCAIVLPITLMVQLIQNWIFGQFLCFFLPMLQDIPIHVSMLSFLLIAVDRYHLVQDPMKPRIPAFVCATGTWFLAVCIVLPYPIYITYIDLGSFAKLHFEGVGICALNLVDDIQEYIRPLFVVMYVAPLASIAYCCIRISRELEVQDGPLAVMMFEHRSRETSTRSRSRTDSHSTADYRSEYDGSTHGGSQYSRSSYRPRFEMYEGELDVCKEIRTQKYLTMMVVSFAVCLFPLMILRLARLAIIETYENSRHFDLIFLFIVWIAFVPTVTTPFLFVSWHMSRLAKERLRGYFRFGNRKLKRSTTDIGTTFTSVSSATGGGLGSSTTTATNTTNNTGSNHHQHRNSNTPIRYPSPVIPNGTIENHHITTDDVDTECTTTNSLTYSDHNKEFPRRPTPPTYITLPSSPAAPAAPIVDDFVVDGSRNNYHHVPLQRQQYHRTRPHRHSSRSHHHHNKMMASSIQIGTDMSEMPDTYDS